MLSNIFGVKKTKYFAVYTHTNKTCIQSKDYIHYFTENGNFKDFFSVSPEVA